MIRKFILIPVFLLSVTFYSELDASPFDRESSISINVPYEGTWIVESATKVARRKYILAVKEKKACIRFLATIDLLSSGITISPELSVDSNNDDFKTIYSDPTNEVSYCSTGEWGDWILIKNILNGTSNLFNIPCYLDNTEGLFECRKMKDGSFLLTGPHTVYCITNKHLTSNDMSVEATVQKIVNKDWDNLTGQNYSHPPRLLKTQMTYETKVASYADRNDLPDQLSVIASLNESEKDTILFASFTQNGKPRFVYTANNKTFIGAIRKGRIKRLYEIEHYHPIPPLLFENRKWQWFESPLPIFTDDNGDYCFLDMSGSRKMVVHIKFIQD